METPSAAEREIRVRFGRDDNVVVIFGELPDRVEEQAIVLRGRTRAAVCEA
jgi:hypothetical protein